MILETQRLILRKPKQNDWKDLVEGCNNLETSRYVSGMPSPYKKKDADTWIANAIKEWRKKKKEGYHFLIELKKEKKVIGGISIFGIKEFIGKCNTGSWINKTYRRKAYMTEAKIAINNYVFDKLKLRKMEIGVFDFNKASRATQKAMGYRYEGTRIKSHRSTATGTYHDEILFGLLKADWKKKLPSIKKKLQQKIKRMKE